MQLRRALRAVPALLLSAVAAAACTSPAEPVPIPPPVQSLCESQPTKAPCREVRVDDGTHRYQLLPAKKPTTETLLIDFGGPGISLLADTRLEQFRDAFPQLARYNLLAVEEPWVTASVPTACQETLTRFYQSLRSSEAVRTHSEALNRACRIGEGRWGFTRASYRSTIDAIAATEKLQIDGFVGHSWGGSRLTYLKDRSMKFAALVRPFPVGIGAEELVTARSRKTAGAASKSELPETAVDGRSVPVSQFDLASAYIGLGYVDDTVRPGVAKLIDGRDPTTVGKLSDGVWGRYGLDSVSLSLLAELDEVCGMTGELSGELPSTRSPTGVLAARFAPCQGKPVTNEPLTGVAQMCLVTAAADSVAPAASIKKYFPVAATPTRWVSTAATAHSRFDGISACLKKVIK